MNEPKATCTLTCEGHAPIVMQQEDWMCVINLKKTEEGKSMTVRANGQATKKQIAYAFMAFLRQLGVSPLTLLRVVFTALTAERKDDPRAELDIEQLLRRVADQKGGAN